MPTRPSVPSLPPIRQLPGALGNAQQRAGVAVRRFIGGDTIPISADRDPGDPGLTGPDSVSWKVIADPASLIGGVRSLLVQACHPLVMQGVADHSAFREDPFGRLRRTVAYVTMSTYGSTGEAEFAAKMVKAAHTHVHGTLPDGRSYRADDPRLLMWVHCSLVDSILRSYQFYGPERLNDEDADRFVEEQSRIGDLLVPGTPRSVLDLATEMASFDEELEMTQATKEAMRFLILPPLPAALVPFYEVLFWGSTALLDDRHRATLGLPSVPSARVATRAAAKTALSAWRSFIPRSEVLAVAMSRASAEAGGVL